MNLIGSPKQIIDLVDVNDFVDGLDSNKLEGLTIDGRGSELVRSPDVKGTRKRDRGQWAISFHSNGSFGRPDPLNDWRRQSVQKLRTGGGGASLLQA